MYTQGELEYIMLCIDARPAATSTQEVRNKAYMMSKTADLIDAAAQEKVNDGDNGRDTDHRDADRENVDSPAAPKHRRKSKAS